MPKKLNNDVPSVWVVTEDLRGTQNQCVGVAECLGWPFEVKTISLNQPWKLFSPYLALEQKFTFNGDSLEAPWPNLVIASGRKSIAAARYIKKQSKGQTFTVYIQDPRIAPKNFDLVALPAHDPTRGKNVIITNATPNRITENKLAEGRKNFPALGKLPSPRMAVLIGGESASYSFSEETAHKLADDLARIRQETGGSLMITASRRTPDHIQNILREKLKGKSVDFWDNTGENPYFGYMGHADTLFVTCDSASMLSEAATTGKPVYMIGLDPKTSKKTRLEKLQDTLIAQGAIRRFEGKFEQWSYSPLNDAQMIADAIKKALPR